MKSPESGGSHFRNAWTQPFPGNEERGSRQTLQTGSPFCLAAPGYLRLVRLSAETRAHGPRTTSSSRSRFGVGSCSSWGTPRFHDSSPWPGHARSPLLSVQELADFLQVPMQTIYGWRKKGDGPKGLRIGRHLRFIYTDVLKWLERKAS